jgi:hypothetical protein
MTGNEKVDLQIRGMPSVLRQRIREKAAGRGMSMSRYVIEILEENIDRSGTPGEWLDEIAKYPPPPNYKPGEATNMIRAMRDAIDSA